MKIEKSANCDKNCLATGIISQVKNTVIDIYGLVSTGKCEAWLQVTVEFGEQGAINYD